MNNNEKGFSLIEILVALGLIGIITLAITRLTLNAQKATQGVETRADLVTFMSEMANLLGDKESCTSSIVSAKPASKPFLTLGDINATSNDFESGLSLGGIFNNSNLRYDFTGGFSSINISNKLELEGVRIYRTEQIADAAIASKQRTRTAQIGFKFKRANSDQTFIRNIPVVLNFKPKNFEAGGRDVNAASEFISCFQDAEAWKSSMCESFMGGQFVNGTCQNPAFVGGISSTHAFCLKQGKSADAFDCIGNWSIQHSSLDAHCEWVNAGAICKPGFLSIGTKNQSCGKGCTTTMTRCCRSRVGQPYEL